VPRNWALVVLPRRRWLARAWIRTSDDVVGLAKQSADFVLRGLPVRLVAAVVYGIKITWRFGPT